MVIHYTDKDIFCEYRKMAKLLLRKNLAICFLVYYKFLNVLNVFFEENRKTGKVAKKQLCLFFYVLYRNMSFPRCRSPPNQIVSQKTI